MIAIPLIVAFGCLFPSIMLIWGWLEWFNGEESDRPFFLAFIGLLFSTASALLAIGSVGYALLHGFAHYDPLLLRIFRWGLGLSLSGMILGFTGAARPNAIRWQAPLAGFGMLAFWFVMAAGE